MKHQTLKTAGTDQTGPVGAADDRYIRSRRIKLPSTTATFVAAVDPETPISFLFVRCRYLSIFLYLATY